MKIWKKTVAIIVVSVVVMALLNMAALSYFVINDIHQTETREAQSLLNRAGNAVTSEVESLGVDCYNWALWDDTYNFVLNPNQGYLDVNFNPASLATINHNIILIMNENGDDVFHLYYNVGDRTQEQFPADTLGALMSDKALRDRTNSTQIDGIISLPSGLYTISSCAILHSDGSGPVTGTFIFGDLVDPTMLGHISAACGAPVKLENFDDLQGSAEELAAQDDLLRSSSEYIVDVNASTALCFGMVDDIHGRSTIVLETEMPRYAYNQGMNALNMMFAAIVVFGIAISIIAITSMDKVVVSRITRLGDDVKRIGKDDSSPQRVSVKGDDEINTLSDDINVMLGSIEKRNQDLVESEGRYTSVMEQSVGAILIIDPATKSIIDANAAFYKLFGYTKDDLFHLTLELINPSNRPKMEAILQRIDTEGSVVGAETSLQHREGRMIDIEIYGSIINYKGKKAYCLTGWDVTERNRVEAAKDRMDKLESVGKLAGGIAHDFNNLLTGIMGNISILKEQLSSVSRACDRLEDTEIAALRAKEIAQELLSLSRGGEPIKQPVKVHELLRTCAHFSFQGSNIKYDFDFPDDLSLINADPGQISRVFFNLFINAKDAMPEGGSVKVSAINREYHQLGPNSISPGRYVMVTIKDTGPGIPPEVLPKIFEPYFTTKKTGAGMGLYVVYATVKRHGGTIEVESTIGQGTTFRVFIPISEVVAKDVHLKTPIKKADPGPSTARVLIMDDQDAVLDVTSDILHELGYEVGMARDGQEALQQYRKAMGDGRKYDLVIMDLTIPQGMGGKEAVRRLLELDPMARAVVSSGYSEDPIMANYRDYGFVGVLPKPFRMSDLAKAVESACSYHEGANGDLGRSSALMGRT